MKPMKWAAPGGLMCMTDLTGTTAIVTGSSRGFGRGIADALAAAGAQVVGVSRTEGADATDPTVVSEVMHKHRPSILVLNAGAIPTKGPIDSLTWAEFGRNWDVDTRHVFEWVRAALTLPMTPGGRIITMSSGAALRGSAASGGYAAAKAAIRFITAYAADESRRRDLGLRFATLFPQLSPTTDLGRAGLAAYVERDGVDPAAFEPALTPPQIGRAVVALLDDPAPHLELVLSGQGARPVG
jgi:NAD(P)-dependent dehydrogenase (short-subunit alcohol dehydrogenase family)